MRLYAEVDNYKLYEGSMLDILEAVEPNTIDSIVTDPPYELNFMGRGWDNAGVSFRKDTWEKCFEVLKPGGYLLAFGGARTYHRIACAIEDAGFEIRDCIMWLYGSGFPKSMNISKFIDKKLGVDSKVVATEIRSNVPSNTLVSRGVSKIIERKIIEPTSSEGQKWAGWGTCLKPAYEPIIVARKPFKGSLVDNVLEYGVGGLNIDECRVGDEQILAHNVPKGTFAGGEPGRGSDMNSYKTHVGRFPANVVHDGSDEACDGMPTTSSGSSYRKGSVRKKAPDNLYKLGFAQKDNRTGADQNAPDNYGDSGSASRYFYCAKASKRDRDEGLDEFEDSYIAYSNQAKAELKRGNVEFSGNKNNPLSFVNKVSIRRNIHPTVKPTSLMQYRL